MAWLAAGAAAAFLVLAFDTGRRGLFESSEGRYGSLAVAMVRSGDWLIPRLNDVKRFEKPPMSMWAMAASVKVLGETEWALRLPGVIAALCGAAVAFAIGAISGDGAEGAWATALTVAGPLYFGLSKALTTDIYLALFSGLTLYLVLRAQQDEAHAGLLWTGAAAAAALGFMTKGPVIWMVTLVPMAMEMAWSGKLHELRRLVHPVRLLVFMALASPWFVLVAVRERGVMAWWIRERTAKVLMSSRGGLHPGPWYYFVPVFLVGIAPAGLILLANLGPAGRAAMLPDRRGRLLLCAAVFPFLMFSASASKLATYILPIVIPTAVLAARAVLRGRARAGTLAACVLWLVAASGGVAAAARRGLPRLQGQALPAGVEEAFAAAGVAIALAALGAFVLSASRRAAPALALLLAGQLVAGMAMVRGVCLGEELFGSSRNVALAARALSGGSIPIVCYRGFIRSLPFYVGHDVIVARYYHRPLLSADEWESVALENLDDVRQFVADGKPVLFVCDPGARRELEDKVGALELVTRSREFLLLSRGVGPPQPPQLGP